jgi:uncharacterized protein (TIGR02596 family)
MHFHPSSYHGTQQRPWLGVFASRIGFTLVEVLIVITVMLLLLTIAGSGVGGMLDSLRMKEAIETVRSTMEQARQSAMISNKEITVRIYKLKDEFGVENWSEIEFGVAKLVTDPDAPGYEDPTVPGYKPKFERIRSVERLPHGMIFHPASTYSQLIDSAQSDLESGIDGNERQYIAFRFGPDGRCNLPANKKWTLTLVKESDLKDSGLPPNYATMQLDPATARVRIYRP